MLRALTASLLLANLAFWAWGSGLLEGFGIGPARERDPTRWAQQVQPQAVRVLPPAAAAEALQRAGAASAASPSSPCPETEPATSAQAEPLRALSGATPSAAALAPCAGPAATR